MCLCRGLEVVCTHTETCESLWYRNVTRLEAKIQVVQVDHRRLDHIRLDLTSLDSGM